MSNVISMPQQSAIEQVLVSGDLSRLTAEQRVTYYNKTCETLGLNPLTRPFEYIMLNGKLILYARKDATEQLRKLHGVSIKIVRAEAVSGLFLVVAEATDKNGRTDSATGAVPFENLRGDALANAMMKAETKAKRRVTLSICGLGMLDESEVESIPESEKNITPPKEGLTKAAVLPAPPEFKDSASVGDYEITFGKWRGQMLKDVGLEELLGYVGYIEKKAKADNKPIQGQVYEFISAVKAFQQEDMMMGEIPH